MSDAVLRSVPLFAPSAKTAIWKTRIIALLGPLSRISVVRRVVDPIALKKLASFVVQAIVEVSFSSRSVQG